MNVDPFKFIIIALLAIIAWNTSAYSAPLPRLGDPSFCAAPKSFAEALWICGKMTGGSDENEFGVPGLFINPPEPTKDAVPFYKSGPAKLINPIWQVPDIGCEPAVCGVIHDICMHWEKKYPDSSYKECIERAFKRHWDKKEAPE